MRYAQLGSTYLELFFLERTPIWNIAPRDLYRQQPVWSSLLFLVKCPRSLGRLPTQQSLFGMVACVWFLRTNSGLPRTSPFWMGLIGKPKEKPISCLGPISDLGVCGADKYARLFWQGRGICIWVVLKGTQITHFPRLKASPYDMKQLIDLNLGATHTRKPLLLKGAEQSLHQAQTASIPMATCCVPFRDLVLGCIQLLLER